MGKVFLLLPYSYPALQRISTFRLPQSQSTESKECIIISDLLHVGKKLTEQTENGEMDEILIAVPTVAVAFQ